MPFELKEAVRNVKQQMKNDGYQFHKNISDVNYSPQQPFSHCDYRPELDTSPTLEPRVEKLRKIQRHAWVGDHVLLPCVAQGFPVPETT